MKKSKRLKLTLIQALTHYGIVLFLLFIVILNNWSLIKMYLTNTYTGLRPVGELLYFSLLLLVLAIIYAIIQYKRLNFREFVVICTDEQFQEAINRTVINLKWKIVINKKTFFRAIRPSNWTGSWGEMVTIIKDKDRLFINSICDPNLRISVASYGWNKENINTFLKNLSDVTNGKPQEFKIEIVENEWTIKRILIRLLAYPVCIFLIIFGIYMIIKPLSIKSVFSGITSIAIAIIYLYSDIKILITKHK